MLVPWFSFMMLFLFLDVGIGSQPRVWLTACDWQANPTKLLEEQPNVSLSHGNMYETDVNIHVTTSQKLQQMVGFGAGLPQASAKVLISLKNSNPTLYMEVMNRLFLPGLESFKNKSIGINAVRFPIGSCDFSMSEHTYDDSKDDYQLTNFKIDDDSMLQVQVLKDAKKINPDLVLMGSPWSPPGWLKVDGTIDGNSNSNTLRSDDTAFQTYASYFKLVVDAFAGFGLPLDYITLQNEPLFAPNYPGMYLSPEDEAKLGIAVKDKIGDKVKILAYDHNWDRPDYPKSVLSAASEAFAGTAWHCYGGQNTAQDEVHNAYPDKETHFTECTGSYPDGRCDIQKGMYSFGNNHQWDMENILLGATTHWSSSGIKWIMALDQNCGPTLPQVSYHNGRPLVSIPDNAQTLSDIKFNQDYWSIGHMSKFITKGSFRAQNDKTYRGGTTDSLIAEAFIDNNNTTTLIVLNKDHNNPLHVGVNISPEKSRNTDGYSFTVPAFGTAIVVLPSQLKK